MVPYISIKLVSPVASTMISINPYAKLSKMFEDYYVSCNSVLFTFSYQGQELDPNLTAADLKIKNRSVINVIRH